MQVAVLYTFRATIVASCTLVASIAYQDRFRDYFCFVPRENFVNDTVKGVEIVEGNLTVDFALSIEEGISTSTLK